MARELVMKASTIEEAQNKIAAAFGVSPEQVQFETLTQPQKKTLGLFGGTDAEVRGVLAEDAADAAKTFLQQVLTEMGVTDAVVTAEREAESCVLKVEGEDLGFIIGRRGETLDALQYLTGLVANRADSKYCRIHIDIGNYREKREQTLIALAKKMAGNAAKTGRRSSLEPMNPYERRIIHTAVQEVEGATSWSVGDDASRHVVIGPSEDNPLKNRRRRSRRGGRKRSADAGAAEEMSTDLPRTAHSERPLRGQDARPETRESVAPGRPVRQFVPRSNPLPMADGATPPQKTESEREKTATLYGRIDL